LILAAPGSCYQATPQCSRGCSPAVRCGLRTTPAHRLSSAPIHLRLNRASWPPTSSTRASTSTSLPGGFRISSRFLSIPSAPFSPHGSRSRLSLATLFTRSRLRVDSGMPTTPERFGRSEPPGRRPPAPGPQLYRAFGRVSELLRPLFTSRFPDSVEPRYAFHSVVAPGGSGMSTTPERYGRSEPPGRRPPAPGPQLLRAIQAGIPIFLEVSLKSHRPAFPSRFPDSVEPSLRFHSGAAPGGLRSAHNP
jgi:hypothetical protein